MIVGIPKEIKRDEYRVAILPVRVEELARAGHRVIVEAGAGLGSGLPDQAYEQSGAELVSGPAEVFGRADMVRRFLASGRSGFYLSVLEEGHIAAGDAIERLSVDEQRFSVPDMFALRNDERAGADRLRRAIELPALAASWREHFRKRLARLDQLDPPAP